jgi:DNA polymerase III epsilon subunit-like protein
MKILFFDTETTGLPKNWKAPVHQLDNWPRLVQIAWQVYSSNGDLLEEHDYVIKPDGFIISLEASAVHKITTEKALETGLDLFTILKVFSSSVKSCGLMVAHNYSYDYNIMGSELLRNGLENSLKDKEHICTMNASTEFCKISGPYGYKWPKLEELYKILFDESFNAHDALDDIRATAKCFWELVSLKIITLAKKNKVVAEFDLNKIDFSQKSYEDLVGIFHGFMKNTFCEIILEFESSGYQLIHGDFLDPAEHMLLINELNLATNALLNTLPEIQKYFKDDNKKAFLEKSWQTLIEESKKIAIEELLNKGNIKLIQNPEQSTQANESNVTFNHKDAIKYALKISDAENKNKALCDIVCVLIDRGRIEDALGVISSIDIRWIQLKALGYYCEKLILDGEQIVALNILLMNTTKSIFPESNTVITLVNKYVEMTSTLWPGVLGVRALPSISKVKVHEYWQLYYSVAWGLIKIGNYDKALDVLAEFDSRCGGHKNINSQEIFDKISCSKKIINHMLENGEVERATNLAPNLFYPSASIGELCRLLLEKGEIEKVKAIANSAEKKDRTDIVEILILHLLKGNNKNEAFKTMNAYFPDKTDQASVVSAIVPVLLDQGEVNYAIELAHDIIDDIYKVSAITAVCKHLTLNGKTEEAIEQAYKLEAKNYLGEHSFENIAEVLAAMSVVLMKQGNNNEAIRISKLFEPLSCGRNKKIIISEMYSQFSKILFDRGKRDEALLFFGLIQTKGGRVFQTGYHMIKNLVGFNKIQESIELADLLEKAALKMNMKVDFLSYAQSKIAFQLMKPGHIRSRFL